MKGIDLIKFNLFILWIDPYKWVKNKLYVRYFHFLNHDLNGWIKAKW